MLNTNDKCLNPSQLRELKRFGDRISKFGANFVVYEAYGELVLTCEGGRFESDLEQLKNDALCVMSTAENAYDSDTSKHGTVYTKRDTLLSAVLKTAPAAGRQAEPIGAVLVDLGDTLSCPEPNGPYGEDNMIPVQAKSEYLKEILELLTENFQSTVEAEDQIQMVSTELARVYEELVLLHKLSTNMKVTESDANFLQMGCDSLTDIVLVEGIAVLLEKAIDGEKRLAVVAGSGLIDIDERMASILHSRLTDEVNDGKEALLDSEVDSPFKYDWPENIRNIIAVPLFGKEKADSHFAQRTKNGSFIIGLMVAINRIDKQDFDSTDVKLFNSMVSGCAVFVENGRLFNDLKELFIGSLKALTNSIDAKDAYTRGHSERVAFISRWIAEKLAEKEPLEEERIHKIYLAGLLHDIGKIGIAESTLRKTGRLTEEERDCINKHPSIGAGILRGIKQMRDIVPGVSCHHERIDGKGYPNGLTGDQIPLTGRIVGLADSFDAMTSKRTYRDAMSVEEALAEVEKKLGTQFDEKIGRVFLESDVYQLWDIIQRGFGETYENNNFSEYGTAAVGTLIR